MARGRPPIEPMPDWPALMTTALAARYLSLDENSLRAVARSGGVGPVDLNLELERWRRTDLDRLVRTLPTRSEAVLDRTLAAPSLRLTDADLDRIATRIAAVQPNANRRAYSVKDAAAACGLSRSTLYRLIGEGQLTPVRLGGRTLLPAEQIEKLLHGAPAEG